IAVPRAVTGLPVAAPLELQTVVLNAWTRGTETIGIHGTSLPGAIADLPRKAVESRRAGRQAYNFGTPEAIGLVPVSRERTERAVVLVGESGVRVRVGPVADQISGRPVSVIRYRLIRARLRLGPAGDDATIVGRVVGVGAVQASVRQCGQLL